MNVKLRDISKKQKLRELSPAHKTVRDTKGNSSEWRKIILKEAQNYVRINKRIRRDKFIWILTVFSNNNCVVEFIPCRNKIHKNNHSKVGKG